MQLQPAPAGTPRQAVWIIVASLLLGGLIAWMPWHQRLSTAAIDVQMNLALPEPRVDDVVVIDIDDASLNAMKAPFGGWPYKRDTYALLNDYLRDMGARGVAFEIVFADPREGDAALQRSLAKAPRAVLAAGALRETHDDSAAPAGVTAPSLAGALQPGWPRTTWPALAMPAAPLLPLVPTPGAVGVISVRLDDDGRLRRMPLLHEARGVSLPSLPLAVLQSVEPGGTLRWQDGDYTYGNHRWPVDGLGRVVVRFPQRRDGVTTLAFARVAQAALGIQDDPALAGSIRGRVAFVGSSAFLADSAVTPQGEMRGAALLAANYSALANDRVLHAPGWPLDAALLALAVLPGLVCLRSGRPAPVRDGLFAVVGLAAVVALSTGALAAAGQQSHALPALTLTLCGLLGAWAAYQYCITQANRRLALERAMADAANRAKSEFLANVSHEIRTPMNSLLGMAELMADTPLTIEQRRYVEIFRSSGRTLFDLINELLDLSKIEAGRLELANAGFSLPALLDDLRALLGPRAAEKNLALNFQVAADAGDGAFGDRQRLSQVLINLVGNAIKFTAAGSVDVSIRRDTDDRDLLHLAVADTGIGIAPSKHQAIFEPFTQGDGVSPTYGGTGLGLSITRNLVELMGGRIHVDSEPGRGTTFHASVRMPVHLLAQAQGLALAAPITTPADAALPLVILLAEDNAVNTFLVTSLLRKSPYVLDTASNGLMALEKFRVGRYDVVLTDMQMPGMDGFTFAREIRRIEAAEGRPRTAVIALTAFAFEADVQRSRDAGCDDHLAKPIGRQQLIDAIERHRPRVAAAPASGAAASDTATRHTARPADPAALAARLAALPHVDAGAALQRLGGDGQLYLRVIEHAQIFLGDWLPGFDMQLQRGHTAQARRLVHDLKSVAAAVGATNLSQAALALELALRGEQADRPIESLRAAVEQHLRAVLLVLTHALNTDVDPL